MDRRLIHIVGLGVAEIAELGSAAEHALNAADVIIGTERQRATIAHLVKEGSAQQLELPKLSALESLIKETDGSCIVVLASGDPLYYGIGRWFSKHFDSAKLCFYPAVSSLQVACHRLSIALQDVEVLSLHGRPVEMLRTRLKRNRQLLLLTDRQSQPERIALECVAAGFGESKITVCENLGYASERVRTFSVQALAEREHSFSALHVTYIHVLGVGGVLPEFPGIPDHHYATGEEPGKGMISKREVRLAILSMLQVSAGDVVWDIGAGCGGVSVELALWNTSARVYAVEHHAQRLGFLRENRQHFGVVQNLHIVEGAAPDATKGLPTPHKVFIGGSDGQLLSLLQDVWKQLPKGGVLVASGVMDKAKEQLKQFAYKLQPHEVESVEINVRRGLVEAGELVYVPKLPVEIFRFVKTTGVV